MVSFRHDPDIKFNNQLAIAETYNHEMDALHNVKECLLKPLCNHEILQHAPYTC